MPGQAQISSIEAIEAFRADLILFLSQMQPLLDEVSGEVVRMRFWLENERREFWQNQIRRRRRQLEEAQAELFNARLSTLNDSSMLQHLAEQKAKKAVEDAEQKLAAVRRWDRDLENLADPMLKQVGQLQSFLATDLCKAVPFLTQVIQALEAYTKLSPSAGPASPPPAEPPPPA